MKTKILLGITCITLFISDHGHAQNEIIPVTFTSTSCQYFWDNDSIRGFKSYDALAATDPRGEVSTYQNRFIWSGSGQAFIPITESDTSPGQPGNIQ